MKLTIVFILLATLNAMSTGLAQTVTLRFKNTSIIEVFAAIRKQTGYRFIYQEDALKVVRKVNVDMKDFPLKNALDEIMEGQSLTYQIHDGTVVVKQKDINFIHQNAFEEKSTSLQEKIAITGRVVDSLGNALEAVNIRVKGTNTMTLTDATGSYHINIPKAGDILEFRILGYTSQEYKIEADMKVLNIKMPLRRIDIKDVVVIGYGEVSKKDLTGSVGQVNMSEITKAPVISFEQALAGRIAGVQVSSNSGQPGSEGINIIVRGAGSLTQSTAPLYVVDDFPMESFDAASLNMEDIESINVLKDASATAIYGARGANGVIVIETKKGQVGAPSINYNGSIGFQETTKQVEMMNPYEFVKYQLERTEYSIETQSIYTPGDLPLTSPLYNPQGKKLEDYEGMKGINWQDEVFRKGITSIHELSLRGGSAQTQYSLSGSIFKQEGAVINSGDWRTTARIAVNQTINKQLKAGVVVNYSNNPSYGKLLAGSATNGYNYLMYSVWGYRPVSGYENESGIDENLLNQEFDSESESNNYLINPVTNLNNEDRKSRKKNLSGNGYIEYRINNNLTLKGSAAYMVFEQETTGFYNSLTNSGTPRNPSNRGVNGSLSFANTNMWKSSAFMTYRKRINRKHDINVMIGSDFYQNASKRYGFATQYVPEEVLGLSGMDDGVPSSATMTLSKNRLNSYFGRANYNLLSKYLFTATFRADGSSKFAPKNRWGNFPSFAAAWRLSDEKFLKNVSFLSDAKLRASFGLTGNNRVSDFAYLATITGASIGEAYSFGNEAPSLGYYPGSPGNEDLKWETTKQIDFGLDLSLFDGKLELVADVYRKNTVDLLLNANTPSHTGFKKAYKNIGELQNDGLELSLGITNIKNKNFSWRSDFNISFNRNKINALTNDEKATYSLITWDAIHDGSYLYSAQVGAQAAMFMGYLFDGIYQVDDFTWQGNSDPLVPHESRVYNLKTNLPDNGGASRDVVQPGDIKYKDINNDGTINEYDETIIGNPMPIHIGGFSNNFKYRNFELNVFLQWSYGNDLFNANRIYFEGGRPVVSRNQFATYTDRWTFDNPSNEYFRTGGQGPVGKYSSKYIEDGSYLRLKTVSLSYTIPASLTNVMKIKELSVSAVAQNLFTWTKYSGMDPEVSVRHSTLTPGFDWSAYPRGRTIVFGIKATL